MSRQAQIREEITAKIVEAIRAGTPPWRRPWSSAGQGAPFPTNALTLRRYSGVNVLLLEIEARRRGFATNWWATFNQWQSLGCRVMRRPETVRPGEWGSRVVLYIPITKIVETEDGEEEEEKYFVMREFTLFNADQVQGEAAEEFRAPPAAPSTTINYQPAEEAMEATGADIRYGGNQAFYERLGDFIQMPPKEAFSEANEFYATGFHELCHWSESRLGWKGSYAMGELIAEIGGCFLCNELAIPQSDDLSNHQAYVAGWLKDLENDHRLIFQASKQASKAADFVLSFSRKPTPVPA